MSDSSKAVEVWQPPHLRGDAGADHAREAKMRVAREAEAAARLAVAKAKEMHAEMLSTGTELVLTQLKKYLRLSESPDFANAIGPLDPATILKMAEFVSKNYRLDNGQSTENIAHVIAPSVDFSVLTQEERDKWREMATRIGKLDE